MTDYYADLDRIRAAGLEYANNGIAAGETAPDDAPFSGEWAHGLIGQDALDAAGISAVFDDLDDFERDDVLDAWEDGYRSADWPRAFDPDVNGYTRALASGHMARHGHALTGYYVQDGIVSQLVRTCECAA